MWGKFFNDINALGRRNRLYYGPVASDSRPEYIAAGCLRRAEGRKLIAFSRDYLIRVMKAVLYCRLYSAQYTPNVRKRERNTPNDYNLCVLGVINSRLYNRQTPEYTSWLQYIPDMRAFRAIHPQVAGIYRRNRPS